MVYEDVETLINDLVKMHNDKEIPRRRRITSYYNLGMWYAQNGRETLLTINKMNIPESVREQILDGFLVYTRRGK